MARVRAGELKLVAAEAVLGLGYRQTKRMWRRYQANGDAGLVHRLRGKPGQWRTAPEVRAQILARYAERYPDFGRTVRRKRQRHRQWRERTPCSRTRVYLDGSHHDLFEGRQERCVLVVAGQKLIWLASYWSVGTCLAHSYEHESESHRK